MDLLFRIYALSPERFFAANGKDAVWNSLDTVIVGVGLADVLADVVFAHERKKFTSIFRLFRLCRLLRVIKLVRFLKPLYLLAHGFVEGLKAVFWVTFLTTGMLYVCSIVLVQIYSRQATESDPDFDVLV